MTQITLFCSGLGYYPHFVNIIRIGHIIRHLARNFRHVLQSFVLVVDIICIGHIIHSFVLVVDIICIGHITSYLDRNTCPILHIYSSIVNAWCNGVGEKCNPSPYCDIFCMV